VAATDVPPIIARIVNRIETVAEVGLVYDHDLWDRDDIAPKIVTSIAGVDVVRAWWVTGPTLAGEHRTAQSAGYIERRWTYLVHGLADDPDGDGTGVNVLRNLGLEVTDALDADRTLGDTAFRTEPVMWTEAPGMALFLDSMWLAYVVLTLPVITLSRPA
jgi:hypothetical protein